MAIPEPALESDISTVSADRGPLDDFFCWKFQIWYPSEDCVYRHRNRTYHECAGCFQGRMNLRHLEKGLNPPIVGLTTWRGARCAGS